MHLGTSLAECREGRGLHRKEDGDGNRNFSSRNAVKIIYQVLMANSHQTQTEIDIQGFRSYLGGGVAG